MQYFFQAACQKIPKPSIPCSTSNFLPQLCKKSPYLIPIPLFAANGLHRQSKPLVEKVIDPHEAIELALRDEELNLMKAKIPTDVLRESQEQLFLRTISHVPTQPTHFSFPTIHLPSIPVTFTQPSSSSKSEQASTQTIPLIELPTTPPTTDTHLDSTPTPDDIDLDESELLIRLLIKSIATITVRKKLIQNARRTHIWPEAYNPDPEVIRAKLVLEDENFTPEFLAVLYESGDLTEEQYQELLTEIELMKVAKITQGLDSIQYLVDLIPEPDSNDIDMTSSEPQAFLAYKNYLINSIHTHLSEIYHYYFPFNYFEPVKTFFSSITKYASIWGLFMLSPYIIGGGARLITQDYDFGEKLTDTFSYIVFRHGEYVGFGMLLLFWGHFLRYLLANALFIDEVLYHNIPPIKRLCDTIIHSQIEKWCLVNPKLRTVDLRTNQQGNFVDHDVLEMTRLGDIILTSASGTTLSTPPTLALTELEPEELAKVREEFLEMDRQDRQANRPLFGGATAEDDEDAEQDALNFIDGLINSEGAPMRKQLHEFDTTPETYKALQHNSWSQQHIFEWLHHVRAKQFEEAKDVNQLGWMNTWPFSQLKDFGL